MPTRHIKETVVRAADIGAATSVGTAGVAWISTALPWLQLIATIIAIFSGMAALYIHLAKIRELREEKALIEEAPVIEDNSE